MGTYIHSTPAFLLVFNVFTSIIPPKIAENCIQEHALKASASITNIPLQYGLVISVFTFTFTYLKSQFLRMNSINCFIIFKGCP
ncbi:hypothetical protein C8D91_2940 [Marinicella litoralis]|uniref:Uncharacterized protein n=1 Tax=Marinicella litoralis TaxID=644220 RepID=A0A4R6X6G1_9GAMM|nr:hypothetical protein C8D91_2940 [Marinicella litoralis]